MKIEHSEDGIWRVGGRSFDSFLKAEEFMRNAGGPSTPSGASRMWNQAKTVALMGKLGFMLGMIIDKKDGGKWVIQDFGINKDGDPQMRVCEVGSQPRLQQIWVSLVELNLGQIKKIETDTWFTQMIKQGNLRDLGW